MDIPIYLQYFFYIFSFIFFIWLWFKFSLLRALIVSLANVIFGIELLHALTPSSPGIMVTLIVSSVLIIFGVWGFILWIKQTANQYNDQVAKTEDIENWWQTVKAFDIILIIGLILRIFIIQPFVIEGPSMDDSFHDKEAILVDKISYKFREPIRGEVIIFIAPLNNGDDYIKRLIGLPGDKVKIERGKVFVNGKQINEPFLSPTGKTPPNTELTERKLGPDEYFVLGDNRPHSSDSREWGMVPGENIIGRAIVALYPFDSFGLIKTPYIYP